VRKAALVTIVVVCLVLTACSKSRETISGSVVRGDRAKHLVKALAGQTLDVSITSDENNAVFQIYTSDQKNTLPGAGESDDATKWSGKVPNEGEYIISVGPTRGNATYKLTYSLK